MPGSFATVDCWILLCMLVSVCIKESNRAQLNLSSLGRAQHLPGSISRRFWSGREGSHLADLIGAPVGFTVYLYANTERGEKIGYTNEYFIISLPAPACTSSACLRYTPPLSLSRIHVSLHIQTRTCPSRKDLWCVFESLSDCSLPSLSILQLRCVLFCQNASVQVIQIDLSVALL